MRTNRDLDEMYSCLLYTNVFPDHFAEYRKNYQSFFLLLLCSSLVFFVSAIFAANFIGIVLVLFGLLGPSARGLFRFRRTFSSMRLGTETSRLLVNGFAMVWVMVLLQLAIRPIETYCAKCGNLSAWVLLFLVLGIIILLHFLLNDAISSITMALSSICLILLPAFAIFPGPAFIGGWTLQLLKSGGGLPVSMILKSNPSEAISGCLVLSSANELIVATMQPAQKDCSIVKPKAISLFYKPNPSAQAISTPTSIITFQRSDVLRNGLSRGFSPSK